MPTTLTQITNTMSVIDTSYRVSSEETSWSCKQIARNFTTDSTRRRALSIRIPESQRLWAWKGKAKKKQPMLIDSIFHGWPIPSCIVNEVERNDIRDYEVWDGRHRFQTIHEFVNNKFKYKNKFYSELTDEERERFDNRKIPVTIVENANLNQLSDLFQRLNAGVPLNDSDRFWANRDKPLMKAVERYVFTNERLSTVFGNLDLQNRPHLANWVAHVYGLSKEDSNYFTTSYARILESGGLEAVPNEVAIREGLDALCTLYEQANEDYPVHSQKLKPYSKIGRVNGYFLADWMGTPREQRTDIIEKWSAIVGAIRSEDDTTRKGILDALQTTGAQNLNKDKIEKVLGQIEEYLQGNATPVGTEFDTDSEED